MSSTFEELDRQSTSMGEISLRRRLEPSLLVDVYEVQLNHEFLMSSLFTVAERAMAGLALAQCAESELALDVLVGGLGLGYTACSVLDDTRVASLRVVDALAAVVGWHERLLVPASERLMADPRVEFVTADFFALVAPPGDFGPDAPELFHAVLVDIDHTPRHLLHASHAAFYSRAGLAGLRARLHPGGVFALWSDSAPDDDFVALLTEEFATGEAHVVTFPNPYTGGSSSNTVYVATTPAARER
ncbi:MAG: spermidine synthase [Acidimicrobiales bacterium]|nr:spermidine synthase [Acidimicrobiales bacterium]